MGSKTLSSEHESHCNQSLEELPWYALALDQTSSNDIQSKVEDLLIGPIPCSVTEGCWERVDNYRQKLMYPLVRPTTALYCSKPMVTKGNQDNKFCGSENETKVMKRKKVA